MKEAVNKTENIMNNAKTSASGKNSGGAGLFGEFGKFVEHLGNEIKKDVAPNQVRKK